MLRSAVLIVAVASLSGCVFVASSTDRSERGPRAAEPPLAIRWSRTSAEHAALFEQTYQVAGNRLRRSADTLSGDWAVVLDADETVLDNSLYQRERAALGLGFTAESWDAWVRREAAPALPGAVAFTRLVGELGGRVVIVTNRDDETCPETRANLTSVGIDAAAVLCQTDSGDKNPRFAMVREGAMGLPPMQVAMWLGDNIQDFPGLSQSAGRSSDFGRRFFILPNPMYGSWTRNPDPSAAPPRADAAP